MGELIQVILPVFAVLGLGFLAVRRDVFREEWIEGLMQFAQRFALPLLLFRAISTMDLHQLLEWRVIVSYYAGATAVFALGILGARLLFGRDWQDSIVIGFACLFANTLLLGLPITERAYGSAALVANYTIISIHSPFCYALGITTMEIARSRSAGVWSTAGSIAKAMLRNTLILGILAGFIVNLTGLPQPEIFVQSVDLLVRTALPVALFALGGVLARYRPEGDLRTIAFIGAVSLLVHPALSWGMATAVGLDRDALRSVILTASSAPGINAFLFANIYGRAKRVAASAVLMGTAGSLLTTSLWLALLP